MKTTRFSFEKAVQEVSQNNTECLKEEFISILEADKEFTRKADYIGFSITSIDNKIASLDEEIQQMQDIKKKLKSAKDIALTVGAEVFAQFGVEKLEGAGISSITVSPETSSSKITLVAKDEAMLIRAGFCKTVVDMDMVNKKYSAGEYLDIITAYTTDTVITKSKPAKLKINKRRKSANTIDTAPIIEIAPYQTTITDIEPIKEAA